MEVDVLDLIDALIVDQLNREIDEVVRTTTKLDQLFASGVRMDAPEYREANAESLRVLDRYVGASTMYESVVTALKVARTLRGEDPYKVDRSRWTAELRGGLSQVLARGAAVSEAVAELKAPPRGRPQ